MSISYRPLGDSGLNVSAIALGTMTWGEQNSEADAHAQIDYALERGLNLIDTAEMYPVPPNGETQGRTESYIGSWFARRKQRERWILASKVAGPARAAHQPKHIRDGNNQLDRKNITQALDASLRRLQTDYIDLYQLHWPDRSTNNFGLTSYPYVDDEQSVPIRETLSVLADLVKAGKIRHIGVSNETPWGVAQFLKLAEQEGLPRIVSIQNPYSLLNRSYEIGLSEFSHREGLSLLGYSPLAFGVLSGKYIDGARPQGARLTLFERFTRYSNQQSVQATAEYVALAHRYRLSPAQLAIAFTLQQKFVTSSIIGATSLAQLAENIDAHSVRLSSELLEEIEEIHRRIPNPVQ